MIELEIERIDEGVAWRSCRFNDLDKSGDRAILKWAWDSFGGGTSVRFPIVQREFLDRGLAVRVRPMGTRLAPDVPYIPAQNCQK
jgi:hypothetical protein